MRNLLKRVPNHRLGAKPGQLLYENCFSHSRGTKQWREFAERRRLQWHVEAFASASKRGTP